MAVDRDKLIEKTPYLLHLTYQPSLERIRRTETLESAGRLLELGDLQHWLRRRRESMLRFEIGEDKIVLTDQLPLESGHIEFEGGWELADLIEALNERVFFWRGNRDGLLSKDKGHFEKYKQREEQLVFLRIPFADAMEIEENGIPQYCRFNSGGPRCSGGAKIPRGPSTFVEASDADFTFGKVREVVFPNVFRLPDSTQMCVGGWSGPWVDFQNASKTSHSGSD